MKNELLIPPVAEADTDAVEVARVWVAKGGQHVSLNVGAWQDPEAWGIVLADLAGHRPTRTSRNLGWIETGLCARSPTCWLRS